MFRRERRMARPVQAPPVLQRYQMREQLISFGDDFYIRNSMGQPVFHVDGKMLRIRKTLYFKDMRGDPLLEIQEKFLHVRDTMKIERNGQTVASVHSALISPIRDRYTIKLPGRPDMEAQGNFVDHAYEIRQGGQRIAEVSKSWFRVADTYGVEVAPAQDDILILAITVCIDAMSHPGK